MERVVELCARRAFVVSSSRLALIAEKDCVQMTLPLSAPVSLGCFAFLRSVRLMINGSAYWTRTCCKVCPGELCCVEELIQISFLGYRLQPCRRIDICGILEVWAEYEMPQSTNVTNIPRLSSMLSVFLFSIDDGLAQAWI